VLGIYKCKHNDLPSVTANEGFCRLYIGNRQSQYDASKQGKVIKYNVGKGLVQGSKVDKKMGIKLQGRVYGYSEKPS